MIHYFLSFIFLSHIAVAKTIDLRSLLPEIRDQGPVGNCYAHTASDLMTVYLKQKNNKFVSPDAISACAKADILNAEFEQAQAKNKRINSVNLTAENIHSKSKKSNFDGAKTNEAIINSMNNCGICLQEEFSKGDIKLLKQFDEQIEAYSKNEVVENKISCLKKTHSILDEWSKKSMTRILNKLNKDKLNEHPAVKLFKKKCKKNKKSKNISDNVEFINFSGLDAAAKLNQIDALLEEGVPVGISYDAGFLKKKDLSSGTRHASTLVGRKDKDGKSYFILRNSWGLDACEKSLKKIPELSFTCDNGDYIIEAEFLIQKVFGITYIKE